MNARLPSKRDALCSRCDLRSAFSVEADLEDLSIVYRRKEQQTTAGKSLVRILFFIGTISGAFY